MRSRTGGCQDRATRWFPFVFSIFSLFILSPLPLTLPGMRLEESVRACWGGDGAASSRMPVSPPCGAWHGRDPVAVGAGGLAAGHCPLRTPRRVVGERGGLGTKGIVKPDPCNSGLCPDAALVLPEVTNIVFNPWHSPPGCHGGASEDGITGRISVCSREMCGEKCPERRKTPDPGMTVSSGWSCSSGKGFQDVVWGLCEQKGRRKSRRGRAGAGISPGHSRG